MDDARTPPAADRVPGGGADEPAEAGRAAAVPTDETGPNPIRRRRRWVVAAVSVAAALLVLGICGGAVALVAAVDRATGDVRDARRQAVSRETGCLELEERLNRVVPPGAAPDPARRAAAIRDENAALRPYLAEITLRDDRWGDDEEDRLALWRQLLDARTAFAEALERQQAAGEPAFFGTPRTPRGAAVADRLERTSPAACAGAIRRLAAPDL